MIKTLKHRLDKVAERCLPREPLIVLLASYHPDGSTTYEEIAVPVGRPRLEAVLTPALAAHRRLGLTP